MNDRPDSPSMPAHLFAQFAVCESKTQATPFRSTSDGKSINAFPGPFEFADDRHRMPSKFGPADIPDKSKVSAEKTVEHQITDGFVRLIVTKEERAFQSKSRAGSGNRARGVGKARAFRDQVRRAASHRMGELDFELADLVAGETDGADVVPLAPDLDTDRLTEAFEMLYWRYKPAQIKTRQAFKRFQSTHPIILYTSSDEDPIHKGRY